MNVEMGADCEEVEKWLDAAYKAQVRWRGVHLLGTPCCDYHRGRLSMTPER